MKKQLAIALTGCAVLVAIYFAASTGGQIQSNVQADPDNSLITEVANDKTAPLIQADPEEIELNPINPSPKKHIKDEQQSAVKSYVVWNEMKELLAKGEVNNELEKQLIESLRKKPNQQVYEEFKQLLQIADSNLNSRNQEYLLSLLAVINTEESAGLLLTTLENTKITDSNAIYVARKSLQKISQSAKHINQLEASFMTMSSDNLFLPNIANGIAKNAAEQNFDFLVAQVDAANEKSPIAIASMTNITNERLVPQLQQLINTRATESELSIASLNTLANMGQYEAAVALIQWSAQQPASSKAFVGELFSTARQRSPSAFRAIEKQLNRQQFTSSEIKSVIEEVYLQRN
ncbi:hypothetical protein [Photobacterium sanguinicancri]|uniref:HEAT repeat domain-containing protein n=1 Tax=Photobacterium sanguinicancri TaxID=875932 RepID=A0ABX4G440_9GAMM|nr:hypothetical protein [Photobacterium sanguinicancri]OZS45956.1 hypothetical protein ASV53_00100 [Photobacterium sanguinicancri]